MPSPVSARRVVEWALRVVSFAMLVVIAMRAWDESSTRTRRASGGQSALAASLPEWSAGGFGSVALTLDSVPSMEQRDWLAALRHAGTAVHWQSSRIVPIAATFDRVADPAGVAELSASVPAQGKVIVRDRVGVMDTVVAGDRGIRVDIPGTAGVVGVSAGGGTAWAAAPDSIVMKRILVEGAASWETKFTIAALSERGWKVDAVAHVAPGVDVRTGAPAAPDTSRYAAIIAVDSTATTIAAAAPSFVKRGGGLVTLHDAAKVGPLVANPVVLERRADGSVRAGRFGDGRVLGIGYADLWRERMSGGDSIADPVAEHRAFLARAVAAVAYAPRVTTLRDTLADPAPLADLVERAGPRSAVPVDEPSQRPEVPSSVLFGVLIAALLLELASRRLRGER